MIKYIIVHGGRAHLDDALACALVMAAKDAPKPGDAPIQSNVGYLPVYRRDPTPEELADPDVVVVDVGGEYDPAKSNFDHHQFGREDGRSAMKLVAMNIRVRGMSYDYLMREAFHWWETSVLIDQMGPFVVARSHGLEWSQVSPFIGPLSEVYLDQFADTATTAEERGRFINATLGLYVERRISGWLDADAMCAVDFVNGFEVLDFTHVHRPELLNESLVQAIAASRGRTRGVLAFIASPRREGETWQTTGITLMRIGEDHEIDFRRVKGDAAVRFVHESGFLAQVRTRDWNEVKRLVTIATGG